MVRQKKKGMNSTIFFIIVTSLFGLFVLFVCWWIWRYQRTLKEQLDDLKDDERELISEFCKVQREKRLANE